MSRTAEWVWIVGACALVHLLYSSVQPVTSRHDGLAYDGQIYFAVAQQTPRQLPPKAPAPFVYRIGTPMAAAAIAKSQDRVLAEGFDTVNRLAATATVLLFAWWLQGHLPSTAWRIAIVILFMLMPHAPLRFGYHYPINVDAAGLMFIMAGLVALDWLAARWTLPRVLALAALVAVGVVFREIVLLIGLACLVSPRGPTREAPRWLAVLPLLAGTATYLLIRAWVTATPTGYGELAEVWRWVQTKSVVQVLLAWLLVFGPMLIVPLCYPAEQARLLAGRPDWLVVLAAIGVISAVGGSDTERLAVFAAPLVYLLIGRALAGTPFSLASSVMALLIFAQLISARVFLPLGVQIVPPHVADTEWNRVPSFLRWLSDYDSLWTQFCGPAALRAYLVWFGALAIAIVAALRMSPGAAAGRGPDAHAPRPAVPI